MQIRNIYFGNVGYTGAWLPPQVHDFQGSDGILAPSTVAFLENGGGKTGMISLLLSIFQPHQSRFLGEIRTDAMGRRPFRDYLDAKGLPGIVAAEIVLPVSADVNRHLLCGYVARVTDRADGTAVVRRFFAVPFDSGAAAADFVHAMPGLGGTPYPTNANQSDAWVKTLDALPGAMATTEQGDWRDWINQQGVDVEMFDVLLEANREEGLNTVGVLDAPKEEDFVAMLLRRSMDRESLALKYDGFKTMIVEMKEYQPLRIHRDALEELLGTCSDLSLRAVELEAAKVAQAEASVGLGRLLWWSRSVSGHVAERSRAHRVDATELAAAAERAVEAEAAATRRIEAVESARLAAIAEAAVSARDAADTVRERSASETVAVEHARLLRVLDHAIRERDQMQAFVDSQDEGIAPFREAWRLASGRFLGALRRRVAEQTAGIADDEAALAVCDRDLSEIATAVTALGRDRSALDERKGVAEERVASSATETERCVDLGHLSPGDDVAAAAAAASEAREALRLSGEGLRKRSETAVAAARAAEAHLAATRKRLGTAEGDALDLARRIAQADEAAARFRTDADLVEALGVEFVDPTVEGTGPALDEAIRGSRLRADDASFLHRAAERRSRSVAVHGVVVENEDIQSAVEACGRARVEAMPYGRWLAEARPDDADELAARRPELLNGIAVAPHLMDRAMATVEATSRKLALPVWVSPMLDPEAAERPGGARAVMPASAAAWSKAAAAAATADTALNDLAATKVGAERLHGHLVAMRARLSSWTESYGKGGYDEFLRRRETADAEVGRVEEEVAAALRVLEEARVEQGTASSDLLMNRDEESEARQRLFALDRLAETVRTAGSAAADLLLLSSEIEVSERKAKALAERRAAIQGLRGELDLRLADRKKTLKSDGRWVAQFVDPTIVADMSAVDPEAESENVERRAADLRAAEAGLDAGALARLDAAKSALQQANVAVDRHLSVSRPDVARARRIEADTPDLEVAAVDAAAAAGVAESAWREAAEAATRARTRRDDFAEKRIHPDETCDVADVSELESLGLEAAAALRRAVGEFGVLKDETEASRQRGSEIERLEAQVRGFVELAEQACGSVEATPSPSERAMDFDHRSATAELKALGEAHRKAVKAVSTANAACRGRINDIKTLCAKPDFVRQDPAMSEHLVANADEVLVERHADLVELVRDRLQATSDRVGSHGENVGQLVTLLVDSVAEATRILRRFSQITIPKTSSVFPGERIVRIRERALAVSDETRPIAMASAMEEMSTLVDMPGRLPGDGAQLVARLVYKVARSIGASLDMEMMKPVAGKVPVYERYERLKHSGGEQMALGMMVFAMIARLRGETRGGRGPQHPALRRCAVMVLDNPFAKMSKPDLWEIVLALLAEMGVQLIAYTGARERLSQQKYARMFSFVRTQNADGSLLMLRPAAVDWVWPEKEAWSESLG